MTTEFPFLGEPTLQPRSVYKDRHIDQMICTTAKIKRTEQCKTLVYKIKHDNKRTGETNKIVAQVLNTISVFVNF